MAEKITDLDSLMDITGGTSGMKDTLHDMSSFITKTVCNIIQHNTTACLTMRKTPNGAIVPGVGWQNGEPIMIHGQYQESGWYFAYDPKTGKFGFVNPNNVG